MLRTDALDYALPPELIATTPATPRHDARLMVLSRSDPSRLEHRRVADLPELLGPADRLVCNTTRVIPARFRAFREDTRGRAEGLYLHDHESGDWVAMIKSRRHRAGSRLRLLKDGTPSPYALEMIEPEPDPPGAWRLRLTEGGERTAVGVLNEVGLTPLPPYIVSARGRDTAELDDALDRERYQTVYASPDRARSVAAPTAGLHFTPDLLDRLESRGVSRTEVVLHVGAGTFKPVETEHVEEHPIHAEWCSVPAPALRQIEQTRAGPGSVIAVGTTSVRALESYARAPRPVPPHLSTRLLLTPGSDIHLCDGLLTNFHLPRSTLMALVGAFLQPPEPHEPAAEPRGVSRLRAAYEEAIRRRYRFYSYGDAMLLLP